MSALAPSSVDMQAKAAAEVAARLERMRKLGQRSPESVGEAAGIAAAAESRVLVGQRMATDDGRFFAPVRRLGTLLANAVEAIAFECCPSPLFLTLFRGDPTVARLSANFIVAQKVYQQVHASIGHAAGAQIAEPRSWPEIPGDTVRHPIWSRVDCAIDEFLGALPMLAREIGIGPRADQGPAAALAWEPRQPGARRRPRAAGAGGMAGACRFGPSATHSSQDGNLDSESSAMQLYAWDRVIASPGVSGRPQRRS